MAKKYYSSQWKISKPDVVKRGLESLRDELRLTGNIDTVKLFYRFQKGVVMSTFSELARNLDLDLKNVTELSNFLHRDKILDKALKRLFNTLKVCSEHCAEYYSSYFDIIVDVLPYPDDSAFWKGRRIPPLFNKDALWDEMEYAKSEKKFPEFKQKIIKELIDYIAGDIELAGYDYNNTNPPGKTIENISIEELAHPDSFLRWK